MLSAWNLFVRRHEPDLCCAVRQDRPIPAFVRSDGWAFGGTLVDNGPGTPAGFQRSAAEEATKLVGFYVFQMLRA